MKKRYIWLTLVAAMLFCICLAGCQNDKEEASDKANVNEENLIHIYYVNDMEIVEDDSMYQLKQPDNLAASVDEIVYMLTEKYQALDVRISSYIVDMDNNMSIALQFNELAPKELIFLVKATISDTVFQLSGLESLTVSIINEAGDILSEEIFERQSFLHYE